METKKANSIRLILIEKWRIVEEIYQSGTICSERHLQAEIFHLLRCDDNFCNNYRIFIEPKIYSTDQKIKELKIKGIVPDAIITNKEKTKIVCVLELKYYPHKDVEFVKDITNLVKFLEIKGKEHFIFLTTDPKNGEWKYDEKFIVDENVLLAYAAIGKSTSDLFNDPEKIWNRSFDSKHLLLKGIVDRNGGYTEFKEHE